MIEDQSRVCCNTDLCPYLKHPLAGCRVQVITSLTIPAILESCGERFTECPLYRNELEARGKKSFAPTETHQETRRGK